MLPRDHVPHHRVPLRTLMCRLDSGALLKVRKKCRRFMQQPVPAEPAHAM